MKITQDKLSTKLVKKYLQKTNSLTFQDTWNGFGDVTIRIVSVGETSKYDWSASKYERVLNIEVTAKKTGYHFSENKIPSKHAWGESQISFYKKRKNHVEFNFNKLILNTDIPMFLKFAGIPQTRYGNQFLGNVKFKFID
jgi:outer membrane lipoprotein-sorting protein